ncbi:MAG: hypothetical protein LKM37_06695 [Bacteroidales bacterium]|jgi:hypothetical protein|nr:hypothetical protein [Bacteroidales bacterium]
MLGKEIIIRRLAIIKYLYRLGVQQSEQVDVVAGFSILSFHDCAEMFLLLVSENKGIKAPSSFMEYWDKFPELTLKESMKALKERRVSIKHKGQFPSKSDIEISRITMTNFMEENTLIQFGIEFKDISVSQLISYKHVKSYIDKAESSYNKNDFYESIVNSKIAFMELLSSYEDNKIKPYSLNSSLNIGEQIDDEYKKLVGSDSKCGAKWFEKVTNTINSIRDILKITALGIDYKRYTYFEIITPIVNTWWENGKRKYEQLSKDFYENNHEIKGSDCRFCIDFVIDNALKLQEFDYNLNFVFKHS